MAGPGCVEKAEVVVEIVDGAVGELLQQGIEEPAVGAYRLVERPNFSGHAGPSAADLS